MPNKISVDRTLKDVFRGLFEKYSDEITQKNDTCQIQNFHVRLFKDRHTHKVSIDDDKLWYT